MEWLDLLEILRVMPAGLDQQVETHLSGYCGGGGFTYIAAKTSPRLWTVLIYDAFDHTDSKKAVAIGYGADVKEAFETCGVTDYGKDRLCP